MININKYGGMSISPKDTMNKSGGNFINQNKSHKPILI